MGIAAKLVGATGSKTEEGIAHHLEESTIQPPSSSDVVVVPENTLQYIFTFPYDDKDDHVHVWGAFFECIYRGSLHELVLQMAEVDACDCMSLTELYCRIQTELDAFMPDAFHALQLYFQHTWDKRVRRRLLWGYSSSDYDNYNLRPKVQAIFFDCDDCLYVDNWKTANY